MKESIFVLCWGDENFARPHPAYSAHVEVYATEEKAQQAKGDSLLSVWQVAATKAGAKADVISNMMARALHEARIFSVPFSLVRSA